MQGSVAEPITLQQSATTAAKLEVLTTGKQPWPWRTKGWGWALGIVVAALFHAGIGILASDSLGHTGLLRGCRAMCR